MPAAAPHLSAFVLAGGKSTRMGTDKAFVVLQGRKLVERALALARSVTPAVSIVGEASKFAGAGTKQIHSGHQLEGGKIDRPYRPTDITRSRRRSDRIKARWPLLALSGHSYLHCTYPLLGVKRTCVFTPQMSASFVCKKTFKASLFCALPN